MGRTSKFSFPIPGRKRTKDKETENPPAKSPAPSSRNLSKAHRILGTDDFSVNPQSDEVLSRYSSSKSSRMSISISESTQSMNESSSVTGSYTDLSEHESGVFPRSQRLRGKPSSTLLGQTYGGDDGTTAASTGARRLRNEDSSSTLKSHYDRQKSPLLISQQTSASSARDLALRKGQSPVAQRSPLLQVEMALDPYNNYAKGQNTSNKQRDYYHDNSRDKESRKKPAKLDLSMLFPKPHRRGSSSSDAKSVNMSPSTTPASTGRRKLSKSRSKESLQSQKHSIHSTKSHDPRQRQTNGTLANLYDHYEQMPARSPRMDRIPESDAIHETSNATPGSYGNHLSPTVEKEQFSWKNVRASMIMHRGESSSAASISSRNTKTSRHTSGSAISNTDLKLKSVLSLSSDSEDDAWEENRQSSREVDGSSHGTRKSPPRSSQPPPMPSPRRHESRRATGAPQGRTFLSAPENPSLYNPLTPPTSTPNDVSSLRLSSSRRQDYRSPSVREKKPSRTMSVTSARSSQQPTPPQSPASSDFHGESVPSSRFMAVTKQEEALLEALRQKRARMREKIIEEHEIAKSPPRNSHQQRHASRQSEASSAGTIRGISTERQKVLLYLDTPLSDSQHIDMSEPSPDLSDFLTFGSDEDSTPRTSWAPPPKEQARPDSALSPRIRSVKASPKTPPSGARLSAVGVGGFKVDRSTSEHRQVAGKRRNMGVRFVEDPKLANSGDFLLDEDEAEVAWDM
ncbi:uncharacterized protein BP5553_04001 [Venustampulla echinocandica]|uniref:Uncharacterized protein n=1 Tax=Venustampulla echinocandica TaxID=2656787 RepID=A0A370TVV5_9HELO|nr:uncharacterized protein BP5553_04001 [Venustampulla echinocandica]RDL39661.1 hypothetical protein BP5553_04001 [Venustampulla echinocandica]